MKNNTPRRKTLSEREISFYLYCIENSMRGACGVLAADFLFKDDIRFRRYLAKKALGDPGFLKALQEFRKNKKKEKQNDKHPL